jgi:ArsR family transcriptional regulator, arsenate/arsenite/antimonite-responsive transcriptional repressor
MKSAVPTSRVNVMFRAFSDRNRLRILNLLRAGELCVCDLVRVIGAPQPRVSRHLAYLRRAKLVTSRKQGLWMYYKLTPPQNPFHRQLLECLSCCFGDVPELAKDSQRLKKACCDTGDCCN